MSSLICRLTFVFLTLVLFAIINASEDDHGNRDTVNQVLDDHNENQVGDDKTNVQGPPATEAVCTEPSDTGPCTNYSVMWHYDPLAGECTRFWFGGCDGNGNRFTTRQECEATCVAPAGTVCQLPKDPGPCYAKESKYYFNFESKRCEEFTYGGCRGNGNRFSSQSECERACHELLEEKEVDPCTQPEDSGRCLAYMQRWFYDQKDGYCKQFIYGGCEGNGNRFDSETDCRARCNARPPIDICTLPEERGRCLGNDQRFYFNAESGQCLTFVYGGCEGNENNFETIEECRKTCSHHTRITVPPAKVDRCQLPREAGRCTNYMSRYFYDAETGHCEHFYYGGCNGNRNRFMSREECTAECITGENSVAPTEPAPTTTPTTSTTETEQPVDDICSLPSKTGSCGAYIISWYYDKDHRRCLQFAYTGCDGNANRFQTPEECESRCQGVTPEDPNLQVTGLAICGLPAERGVCGENQRKWHYDTESGQCKEFIYSGCEGNYNNFISREECEGRCPVTNICYEPAETGPCRAAKRKYYFDANADECRPFTYGGCAGNANRFSSMEVCRRVCQPQERETQPPDVYADPCTLPMDRGPCTALYESWYFDVNQGQCVRFNYGGCGGNYNRFNDRESCQQRCETTAVVDPNEPDPYQPDRPVDPNEPEPERPIDPFAPVEPNTGGADVCDLPKDPGPCTDNFTAVWYFEPTRRQCRRFLYGGCPGNDNRFTSREECENRCLNRGGDGGAYEPEPQTYPPVQPTYAPQNTAYPPYETPQPTVYPPYEPSQETGETDEPVDVCRQPKRTGPCEALFEKWYFDEAARTCLRFNYGGCDGNENNFDTAEDCYYRCGGQPPNTDEQTPPSVERCRLPVDSGPCYAAFLNFYFDDSIGECRPFTYGGCQGNDNRFDTQESCYQTCGQEGKDYRVITPGDCYEPQDPGTGYDYEARWSFNADKAQCEPFYFSKPGGNRNNFHSYEDCLAMCVRGASVPCRPLACDLSCPFGFKQGEDGCPTCQCEDPCERYACNEGEECILEEVECVSEPCLPVPTCRATDPFGTVKPGYCPQVDSNTLGICSQDCGADSDCLGTQKCCSNGCGTYCTEPEQPENKPGFCPMPDEQMRTVCENICYSDADCPDERKCCSTGCGAICMSPSHTSHGNDHHVWTTTSPAPVEERTTWMPFTRDWQPPTPYYPDPYSEEHDRLEEDRHGDRHGEEHDRDRYEPTRAPTTWEWQPPTPYYPDRHGEGGNRENQEKDRHDSDRDRDHWDQDRHGGDRDHWDREGDRDGDRWEGQDRDNTVDPYPEEAPQITSTGPTNVDAAEGSIVVLPCEVRAAPAAVIAWYKNGQPIQGSIDEKARMLDGGSLEIVDVTAEDSASYICRAYNGIGDGATREYTIRINTPVRFMDEQSDVTVAERATARLTCTAEGTPQPRIRWLHNGRDVLYDGLRIFLEEDGSTLSIEDVSPRDEGEYICEAHNGVSEPIQRTMRLNVRGQIYAQIVAHNTSFSTGDEVHLKCRVQAEGDFKISWQRNGQPLQKDSRISHPKPSQLLIKSVTTDDQGTYTCLVTRDQNQFSVDTNIEVQGLSLPLNCIDKPWYANCKLIVKANMCKHIYFSDFCCLSCHQAGLL